MQMRAVVAIKPKAGSDSGGIEADGRGVLRLHLGASAPGRPRRRTAEEKLAVVMESLRGNEPNVQICRRHHISEPTLYKWRQTFLAGGKLLLESVGQPNVPALLEENRQLKETLADLSLAYRRLRLQRSKPPTKVPPNR